MHLRTVGDGDKMRFYTVCVWGGVLINAQTCTRQDVVAMTRGSSRSVHMCVCSGALRPAIAAPSELPEVEVVKGKGRRAHQSRRAHQRTPSGARG